MAVFNPTQKITAKLFYNLVAQLQGAERAGAIKALSVLIPATEDGFMTINELEPKSDFFVQCFDVMLSVALALKMLEDDGLVPELQGIKQRKGVLRLTEADAALRRIEHIISMSPKPSTTDH